MIDRLFAACMLVMCVRVRMHVCARACVRVRIYIYIYIYIDIHSYPQRLFARVEYGCEKGLEFVDEVLRHFVRTIGEAVQEEQVLLGGVDFECPYSEIERPYERWKF